jgi:hypothetical protein
MNDTNHRPVAFFLVDSDTWLNCLALKLRLKHVVPEVLQCYRRHDSNASSFIASRTTRVDSFDLIREYKDKDTRLFCSVRLEKLLALEKRLNDVADTVLSPLGLSNRIEIAENEIREERVAIRQRLEILARPRCRRLGVALRFWQKGQYSCFRGWKSLVKDMISP